MGPECDEVRPGGMLDTSDFALSHQLPSSGRRTTISVATNHPPVAARHGRGHASKKPPPP